MRLLLPLLVAGLLAGCERGGGEPDAQPTPAGREAAADTRPASGPVLSADGYGPVTIGMSEAEARQVLGPQVQDNFSAADEGADPCRFIWVGEEPRDVVYMVEDQRISRITVAAPRGATTDKGLALGATEADVRKVYGDRLEVGPSATMNPPAKALTVWKVPGERGLRYETDAEGRVSEIDAGGPSIRRVAACS